ncbi:hypothetical protein [Frankia tisae]|uniref:hypothetical protein n=1 Tax=Frankia tisae TaxID=2950104 RepID=UPI0021BF5D53|nr:hypothetical protein [Frankia tisae]
MQTAAAGGPDRAGRPDGPGTVYSLDGGGRARGADGEDEPLVTLRYLPLLLARADTDPAAAETGAAIRQAWHALTSASVRENAKVWEGAIGEVEEILRAGRRGRSHPAPTDPTDPTDSGHSGQEPTGLGPARTAADGDASATPFDAFMRDLLSSSPLDALGLTPPVGEAAFPVWLRCTMVRLPSDQEAELAVRTLDALGPAWREPLAQALDLVSVAADVQERLGPDGLARFETLAATASAVLRLVDLDDELYCAHSSVAPPAVGVSLRGHGDHRSQYRTAFLNHLRYLRLDLDDAEKVVTQLLGIHELVASVYTWPLPAPGSWWAEALATVRAEVVRAVDELQREDPGIPRQLTAISGRYADVRRFTLGDGDLRVVCPGRVGEVIRELRPYYRNDAREFRGRAMYGGTE